MNRILHVQASIFGAAGQSAQLAARFLEGLRARHPHAEVVTRDLAADPVPHLDAATFAAFSGAPTDPAAAAGVARSDALVAELQAADLLVISLPLYNFGPPSAFKAWLDHVARAGVTFRYGANGPEGLVRPQAVYVFAARGGQYAGTPLDNQRPWLDTMLGFLGAPAATWVFAEGLARTSGREDSLASARAQVDALLAAR